MSRRRGGDDLDDHDHLPVGLVRVHYPVSLADVFEPKYPRRGGGPGPHYHDHEDEWFYIVEGRDSFLR
jgi:mannose-6-phosphate isomerase-like protein (cupin superfamily)